MSAKLGPIRILPAMIALITALTLVTSATARQPDFSDSMLSVDDAFAKHLSRQQSSLVLDQTVEMTCAPPSAGMAPPCVVPVGLDPDLLAPNPSGELRLVTFGNDSTLAWIHLDGMAPDLVITAWLVYTPPGMPPPAPIFEPIGPGMPRSPHPARRWRQPTPGSAMERAGSPTASGSLPTAGQT